MEEVPEEDEVLLNEVYEIKGYFQCIKYRVTVNV